MLARTVPGYLAGDHGVAGQRTQRSGLRAGAGPGRLQHQFPLARCPTVPCPGCTAAERANLQLKSWRILANSPATRDDSASRRRQSNFFKPARSEDEKAHSLVRRTIQV